MHRSNLSINPLIPNNRNIFQKLWSYLFMGIILDKKGCRSKKSNEKFNIIPNSMKKLANYNRNILIYTLTLLAVQIIFSKIH